MLAKTPRCAGRVATLRALGLLRWTLAVVLGGQASAALIPPWEHPLVLAIAGAELAGCVAIALRARWRAGYALVFASLFAATVVHAMLGQAPPPAFAIDAACVVVLAVDARAREEAADAR